MPANAFSDCRIKHEGHTEQSVMVRLEDGEEGIQDWDRLLGVEERSCNGTSHSTDEENEGQRGKMTAPKSCRPKIRGQFSWVPGQHSFTRLHCLPSLAEILGENGR